MTTAVTNTKPGRKPLGDAPLTPAEKQRAYRERERERAMSAMVSVEGASRVTLLAALADSLATLDRLADSGRAAVVVATNRQAAASVIQELVTRYGLTQGDVK